MPSNPIFWNPYNQVVQNHQTGEIDISKTNLERKARGLSIPWTPKIAAKELGL